MHHQVLLADLDQTHELLDRSRLDPPSGALVQSSARYLALRSCLGVHKAAYWKDEPRSRTRSHASILPLKRPAMGTIRSSCPAGHSQRRARPDDRIKRSARTSRPARMTHRSSLRCSIRLLAKELVDLLLVDAEEPPSVRTKPATPHGPEAAWRQHSRAAGRERRSAGQTDPSCMFLAQP